MELGNANDRTIGIIVGAVSIDRISNYNQQRKK